MNVVKIISHIGEDTDFPWQKPWRLPSMEVNFKAWDCIIVQLLSDFFLHRVWVQGILKSNRAFF